MLALLSGLLSACAFLYPDPIKLDVLVEPGALTAVPGQSVSFYAYADGVGQDLVTWQVGTLTPDLTPGPLPPGLVDNGVEPGEPGVIRITLTLAADFSIPELDVYVFACVVFDPSKCFKNNVHLTVLSSNVTGALPEASDIVAGFENSFALLADGSVWAWGSNDGGRLGDGRTSDSPVPVPVHGLPGPAIAITAGDGHSMALLVDGSVGAWGNNNGGRLGDGTTTDSNVPVPVAGLPGPVAAVAAGGAYSLALLADGSVWAWGSNLYGQLGNGTITQSATAHPIPAPVIALPGPVTAITAGASQALALLDDGSVWAWGRNDRGQLGNGTMSESPIPIPAPVTGLPGPVTAIAGRSWHSLALLADGSVWAWGNNNSGELGDPGTTSHSPIPVPVAGLPGPVAAVAGGSGHSLAILTDGSAWAWGLNNRGQLGIGTTLNSLVPVAVTGLPPGRVQALAAGYRHSLLLVDCGQIWAAGANALGQLGDGSIHGPYTGRADPAPVARIGEGGACSRVALRIRQTGPIIRAIDTDQPALGRCEQLFCSALFDSGQTVTLSADPLDFLGWDGDCQGSAPTVSVQLDRSKDCFAAYGGSDLPVALSALQPGVSGLVTSAPDGGLTVGNTTIGTSLDCGEQCTAFYAPGTVVTLTATPNPGYRFNAWVG
ncbi:MAG: RCC1 domain-containing protein, partial [Planctomycetota bacterium]